MMADIEINDMIFGISFFGKHNFEVMTYSEYKFVEPNFVLYTLEHPITRDVYINIKMNMFVDTNSNPLPIFSDMQVFSGVVVDIVDNKLETMGEELPDVYRHMGEEYGNDFRMDMEEVILWLQDNEWPANYNGFDLDEVR
tara:strand:+ start:877 stop:1296 length:420 start_codon:yes stop_codon:yes gene_type:complete